MNINKDSALKVPTDVAIYLLDNWSVIHGPATPYTPTELLTQHLHGQVYGRPSFAEGAMITTSPIVGKSIVSGQEVVITSSRTLYVLGTVEPQYEALHPEAKLRLFSSLSLESL